jgi:hypothetical protein
MAAQLCGVCLATEILSAGISVFDSADPGLKNRPERAATILKLLAKMIELLLAASVDECTIALASQFFMGLNRA